MRDKRTDFYTQACTYGQRHKREAKCLLNFFEIGIKTQRKTLTIAQKTAMLTIKPVSEQDNSLELALLDIYFPINLHGS